MKCKPCGCQASKPCSCKSCEPVETDQLGTLNWLYGKDAGYCPAYEPYGSVMTRITAGVLSALCERPDSPLDPVFLFGGDAAGNCPVKFTPAQLIESLQVADTDSVDMHFAGGVISADVKPQWVRERLGVIDTEFVDMSYDPATGLFSSVIDPAQVVDAALCDVLHDFPLDVFQYGVTELLGSECKAYAVPAQTLAFDDATRQLSISHGNSVAVPDRHISGFAIAGNVATITRNDGVVFQQVIPMTVDINVASFSLVGNVLTITETDGTVHSITLPVDCCPTALQVIGNQLVLTLSNGTVFNVPLPDEVQIASMSVAGNSLTIVETDGSTFVVNLPQVNVVSSDGSVSVVTNVSGSTTTYDLSVNFPSPADAVCAQVIACLTEGQNIDIEPTGVISAGYLRSDGASCFTWVNQDGTDVYSFCLPIETPLTVIDSATIDFSNGGVAGHSLTGVVRISPAANQSIIVDAGGLYVPDLCAQLVARAAGAAIGQGQGIEVLASDCTRRTINVPADVPLVANDSSTIDFSVSGVLGHILTGSVRISTTAGNVVTASASGLYAPNICTQIAALSSNPDEINAGESIVVVDADTCQRRRVNLPSVFNLCAALAALANAGTVGAGQSVTVVLPTCATATINIPPSTCTVIGGFPVGVSIGAGQAITLIAADCTRRVVTLPAAPGNNTIAVSPDNGGGTLSLAGAGGAATGNIQNGVLIDTGDAPACTTPAGVRGSDGRSYPTNVLMNKQFAQVFPPSVLFSYINLPDPAAGATNGAPVVVQSLAFNLPCARSVSVSIQGSADFLSPPIWESTHGLVRFEYQIDGGAWVEWDLQQNDSGASDLAAVAPPQTYTRNGAQGSSRTFSVGLAAGAHTVNVRAALSKIEAATDIQARAWAGIYAEWFA